MASIIGISDCPMSVSEYTTLGGTSANTSRAIIPSLSSERRLSVRTFCEMPGTPLFSCEKRCGSFNRLLGLTGAEISINELPAGAGVPFVHSHRQNEEIYGILAGKGRAVIDGEEVELAAGDWLRVAPAAKRQFSAAADSGIKYVCIQVKQNSLESYTADDAVM